MLRYIKIHKISIIIICLNYFIDRDDQQVIIAFWIDHIDAITVPRVIFYLYLENSCRAC